MQDTEAVFSTGFLLAADDFNRAPTLYSGSVGSIPSEHDDGGADNRDACNLISTQASHYYGPPSEYTWLYSVHPIAETATMMPIIVGMVFAEPLNDQPKIR